MACGSFVISQHTFFRVHLISWILHFTWHIQCEVFHSIFSNVDAIVILTNLTCCFNRFLFCLLWNCHCFSLYIMRLFAWNHDCSSPITSLILRLRNFSFFFFFFTENTSIFVYWMFNRSFSCDKKKLARELNIFVLHFLFLMKNKAIYSVQTTQIKRLDRHIRYR
jgi:hypothetical protein